MPCCVTGHRPAGFSFSRDENDPYKKAKLTFTQSRLSLFIAQLIIRPSARTARVWGASDSRRIPRALPPRQ